MSKIAHMDDLWAEMPLFLALARNGALQKAADKLDVNRTTVARRLAVLEQKLGTKLFSSSNGVYELTSMGRDLMTVAEAAEAALYQSEALLFSEPPTPKGPLKITVPPHLMQIAAPLFPKLASKFPDLQIDLVATYQLEAVEARDADLALRILRKPPQFPLYGRKLLSLRGAVFRAKGKSFDECVELVRHGEVVVPAPLKNWPANLPKITIDDIWAKQELIAAGGFGRLPLFMGDADPRLERASDIMPDAGWRLWLVTQDAFRKSPRLRLIIDELSNFFLSLDVQ